MFICCIYRAIIISILICAGSPSTPESVTQTANTTQQKQTETPEATPPNTTPVATPIQTPTPAPPSQQQQPTQPAPASTSFLGKLFGSKPTPVKGTINEFHIIIISDRQSTHF